MKFRSIMLWSLLGCVGVSMLAGIVTMMLPSRLVDDRVLVTIIIIGMYSLGGLVIVAVGERMRWTRRVCITFTLVSMAIYILTIWFEGSMGWRFEQWCYRSGTAFLVVSIVLAHRLLLSPIQSRLLSAQVLKRTALITGPILGGIIVFGLMNNGFWDWEELVLRIIGIFAIVTAGATIATGALVIFGSKPGDDDPGLLAGSIPVSMSCPRCACDVVVRSNHDGRCSGCRLKVRIEIEEPRCACGYLLFELESDTCPECGNQIPEKDRWGRA